MHASLPIDCFGASLVPFCSWAQVKFRTFTHFAKKNSIFGKFFWYANRNIRSIYTIHSQPMNIHHFTACVCAIPFAYPCVVCGLVMWFLPFDSIGMCAPHNFCGFIVFFLLFVWCARKHFSICTIFFRSLEKLSHLRSES